MFKRKKKKSSSPILAPDDDMVQPQGQNYLEVLKALHEVLEPDWYLEIGTQRGTSLRLAECNSIAIDPNFLLDGDVVTNKPNLHMLQQPSDDAFEAEFFATSRMCIDFAFLDGMHLFEFILRDFINTERHANKGAVVTIHDCIPFNRIMAKRTWDKAETRQWTGDVWKIVPVLRALRPDLTLQVLDCAPTGLLLISDLDPANTTLGDNVDQIIADHVETDLDTFGIDQFTHSLSVVDSKACYAKFLESRHRSAFNI